MDEESLQAEQTRQEIRQLLGEIAELSRLDLDPDEYFPQFLSRVVSALAATGGAVWTRGESGEVELVSQVNLNATELAEGGDDELHHSGLLAQVFDNGESLVIPPYSGNEDVGNPTRFLLLLTPLRSGDKVEGIVEIFQRPGADIHIQRGYLNFLHSVCDLAGDWIRRQQYRQLSDQQSHWRRMDELSQTIHESLSSKETAFALANEARSLLGCDRVSVATRRGSSFRVEAISGQDTIDRRSSSVTLLQKLTRRVLAAGDPLWYTGSTDSMPPQIEQALQAYVDFANSKTIGIVPMRRTEKITPDPNETNRAEPEIVGALVVEQIEDNSSVAMLQQRTDQISAHAARAVTNAYDHDSLFLMPLWRAIGHSRMLVSARNLPKTLLVGVGLLIAAIACLVVPIRFDLEGKAELQPIERRHVFSSLQGVVTEVHVDTGDPVEPGDKLLTLRNTDLMVQIEDLEGRSSVAGEDILELQRRLLDGGTSSPQERARWASELASLRRQQANYQSQLKLLRAREKRLTITSPIEGEVITWDARRTLHNRPVLPGQVLMTVADTNGKWELLIHMPEDNIGYISDAQAEMGEKLEVTYIMATDPSRQRRGKVRSVHDLAEPHESTGHAVKIAVKVDERDLIHPRPGATATAQVHCGRRSIAFVWLHDVVEFFQTKVWF